MTDNSSDSAASGGRFAANNGSTVTDNSDNSSTAFDLAVSDSGNDNSMADNSTNTSAGRNAANGGSTVTDSSDNSSTSFDLAVADSGNDNSTTDNSDNSSTSFDLAIADSGNDNSTNDSGNDNSTDTSASAGRFAANGNSSVTDNSNNAMTDNSVELAVSDSGNDNSDNSDRSVDIADSYNIDSSNDVVMTGSAATSNMFGDGALVATATLSSYVTGVTVTYDQARGSEGSQPDNSLTNSGGAFQNFAGMQALNQNTGIGASQNANVSVAVSTGDVTF